MRYLAQRCNTDLHWCSRCHVDYDVSKLDLIEHGNVIQGVTVWWCPHCDMRMYPR